MLMDMARGREVSDRIERMGVGAVESEKAADAFAWPALSFLR